MIFDSDGATTIVFQEDISLQKFLKNLNEGFPKIKNDHIIVNLFSFSNLTTDDLMEFYQLSDTHRKAEKSFVLVTDKVPYDQVPEALIVVPTLQEAQDIIEMEEIERDLDL
ncbi:ribonuclease Z [Pricia sp. S334]|uniref:Ribonuclease Z n=1 Tax=Pricia mediterranea TaxID=3076079 RepID=A0ABU3L110_9FLAO|nr:ribonuclease Z [Pricia sp. S334]MDT7827310.1 ribonuclease Z [Pricia sp. S334]